ncbi:MAG: 5-(carboxyamino)imidazole ribonucleotide synthase [Firmicutes bacterium]|nr:5-(carboxyamino)imidazole ribonucleotide synthase [Bacillota bacterium]
MSNNDINYLGKRIGIIGGGQLGQMMALEAKKMGFYLIILDPTPDCPAHTVTDGHIIADFDDKAAIRQLAEKCDVMTYEFEHINTEILLELESEGYKIYPTAKSLKIIQNKLTQKQTLAEHGLPVPDFIEIKNTKDMYAAGEEDGYPYMLKTCTGGYVGKGNAVVNSKEETDARYKELGNGSLPLMAEKMVDFKIETSILACRGLDGQVVIYPVGNNIHKDSILHETIVPADIPETAVKKASECAKKVMEVFLGIGMFCVELFITQDDDVLINEIAPRPHNSGHYTIEGCVTSQFENHIRAVAGLPLGDTSLIRPTVMVNLLGAPDSSGKARVYGIYDALSVQGAFVHIYGKSQTKPKRKMGHITVCADSTEKALSLAEEAYNKITIKEDEDNG